MQFLHFISPALGVTVIAGSIAVMTEILRRSAFVPLLAIVTGMLGIFFFSNVRIFTLPGVALSLLAIVVGGTSAVVRRRAARRPEQALQQLLVLSDSGKWRLRAKAYLSDSGHWRLRVS